jgi:carbamate kinase
VPGIVIAIGGNAISDPSAISDPRSESASLRRVARSIAKLYLKNHRIAVTHGNGPQVGRELERNELAAKIVPELPLYYLTAETESVIGSAICTALCEELLMVGKRPEVCTVISHVIVDQKGRAPRKPVGNFMSASELRIELKRRKFEYIRKGDRYRRVVPSPRPLVLLESDMINSLCSNGIVVAAGGGGIPMVSRRGRYHGVDAVIDKDLTSALLAHDMGADKLVILTDTDYLYSHEGGRPIKQIDSKALSGMLSSLEEGTIRPKVQACLDFVRGGGKSAYIGNLYRLEEILGGASGTKITR